MRHEPGIRMAAFLSAGLLWGCSPTGTTPIGAGAITPTPPGAIGGVPVSQATARPTTAPTATPTTAPSPTATVNPESVLYPGPVRFVSIKVFSARGVDGFREPPFEDGQGNQVVYVGETVVFDATPKNERNQQCETDDPPRWYMEDNQGIIQELTTSNPFLMRTNIIGRTSGTKRVHVFAEIDRVLSNHLFLIVK